jgi:hypothetical protein
MPWPIHYHEHQPERPQPGDMWPEPAWLNPAARVSLSPEYFRDHADKRPPLMVCLPNGTFWCIDTVPSKGGSGWNVSGEPPYITVSPSIYNAPGTPCAYHGFLTNGVLSDDCEGRTFQRS